MPNYQKTCPLCSCHVNDHKLDKRGILYCPAETFDNCLGFNPASLEYQLGELLMHVEGCEYYHRLVVFLVEGGDA